MRCFAKGEGNQVNAFNSLPITSGLLSTNASFEKKANPNSAISRAKMNHPQSAVANKYDVNLHK